MSKPITYIDGLATSSLKKQHKKRNRILSLIVIVILIGGGVYYIMSLLNGSAKGVVTNPTKAQQNAGLSFDFTPVSVENVYVSFTYPRAMSVYTAVQKQSYPTLAAYEYSYKDIRTWLMTVSVNQLLSNSLQADSSYNFRLLNPNIYQHSTVTINNKTYQVMTDTTFTGFNEVAFSLHDGMSGDISLLGNDSLGTTYLQKTFNMVLASFTWR
jgi:flagellar basal body-associated protein FliL